MKKNDWLEKLSLADKKYVDEANPALSYTEKPAPKRRIKWGRVTAMAACFLAVLFTVALFVPYSYSPPSVKRYADSEYYSVIEKLNIWNYENPLRPFTRKNRPLNRPSSPQNRPPKSRLFPPKYLNLRLTKRFSA